MGRFRSEAAPLFAVIVHFICAAIFTIEPILDRNIIRKDQNVHQVIVLYIKADDHRLRVCILRRFKERSLRPDLGFFYRKVHKQKAGFFVHPIHFWLHGYAVASTQQSHCRHSRRAGTDAFQKAPS